jgi:hypothetical protein
MKDVRTTYTRSIHQVDIPAGYTLDTQLIPRCLYTRTSRMWPPAHRDTQGWANKWADIVAVIGEAKAEQTLPACASRLRVAHPYASIPFEVHWYRTQKEHKRRSRLTGPTVCTMCFPNVRNVLYVCVRCAKWSKQSETLWEMERPVSCIYRKYTCFKFQISRLETASADSRFDPPVNQKKCTGAVYT